MTSDEEESINQTNLVPAIVQHDCTAHWYSSLVLHEVIESTLVVPMVEQRTSCE